MIPRPLFSRWVLAAGVAAVQIVALASVLAQAKPQLSAAPAIRSLSGNQVEQALVGARAAMKAQDFARAYTEYRAALNLVPSTGPQHDEALRGFSEAGVKLAQQRLNERRAPEAERIAREVLGANASYRPALELIARLRTVPKNVPALRPTPPLTTYSQPLPQPTPPSTQKKGVLRIAPPPPMATVAPRLAPMATPPPRQLDTATRERREAPSSPARDHEPAATLATVKIKQPLVKVFFATDRKHTPGATGSSNNFGTDRNHDGDNLLTGFVTVSIPPVHKEGTVERPFKWWIIEFQEDPKKHFVLSDLKVVQSDDFYGALKNEYDQREPDKQSALVFIHGFNVSFDDAAFNTAQLAYDLDFEGVPIMYSWPSRGYAGDQETVEWSSPHLQRFLERVAKDSGARRIHVFAHSMGNRLLAKALVGLAGKPDILPLFTDVIMSAPDVSADNFTQDWPEIKKAAKRFTLYASSNDRVLRASKEARGGSDDFTRLGEGGPEITVIPGLDTIDASGIDTSLLGHSYADSCKPVLNDLQALISKGWTPLERKLRDRNKNGLAYWAFPQ